MSSSKFNEALANMKPVELDEWAYIQEPLKLHMKRGDAPIGEMAGKCTRKYAFELKLGRHLYCEKDEVRMALNHMRREILHYLFGDVKFKVQELYSMFMMNAERREILDKFDEIMKEMSYD